MGQMLQFRHLPQHFVRSLYGECCIVYTMLGPTNCAHLCVGVTMSWHLSSKREIKCVCVCNYKRERDRVYVCVSKYLSTCPPILGSRPLLCIMRWYRLTYFIPQDMTVLCSGTHKNRILLDRINGEGGHWREGRVEGRLA